MTPISVPTVRTEQLSNGLQVCLVERRHAPVVATALCYRSGTLHEPSGQEGIAHFFEHMMFRGARRFGPGEIDDLTQALGGSNNADTSHDCTTYFFSFASDRWTTALDIEADRMSGLLLEHEAIDVERAIILEEVKMIQDDPWDALEEEVMAALFGDHPYGRPILGTSSALMAMKREDLLEFQRLRYRPDNAVLAIVGDVGPEAFDEAGRIFAEVRRGDLMASRQPGRIGPVSIRRVERRLGRVSRLLCAVPGPALREREYPAMRLLAAMLGAGRASRLHRVLVEEMRSCAFVSVDTTETLGAGTLLIAAEVIPDVQPERVERRLMEELARASSGGFDEEELARAKSVLVADWVLGHEQALAIALTVATAGALMDVGLPARHLEKIRSCSLAEVERVAARYLRPDNPRVIGWSLPEGGRN